MDTKKIRIFRAAVWRYYRMHKRAMPWRNTRNPYKILVSEAMLQQTQVSRIMEKYPVFIKKFPDFRALVSASPRAVLIAWQGLGYNRRALSLKKCAEIIVREYRGILPRDPAKLEKLPGIGKATAGSIAAFAFNAPVPFIETNIRRVFIHFFFPEKKSVRDEDILEYVAAALPRKKAREWYYALMDYGAMLAKTISNPNKKSAHYSRQSRFSGSDRELRGKILKFLLQKKSMTFGGMSKMLREPIPRVKKICAALEQDGFIKKRGGKAGVGVVL
ncbi:MAG: A/G-specific adenine glycosylase [bacterium]|nr:A/G-specific adenine glycosylase [bacterium]